MLPKIIRYMNKRLTTDMADANGLQRAIRPTGFFNMKKMAADFCTAQCIMDNTGSLKKLSAAIAESAVLFSYLTIRSEIINKHGFLYVSY